MNLSRIVGTRPFTPADARLLQIFAENVASAIVRIRQFEALDEKAGQLERAKASLVRSNRAKEVFLAVLRDELRGPCTVLSAYADFLASAGDALQEEKRRSLATILRDQVRRLEGLTGNIQNISRLEGAVEELRVDPCHPNKLVTEVSTAMATAAAGNGSNLVTRLEPGLGEFPMDRGLLLQAARALTSGALSAAAKNAEISLAARAEKEGWTFEVRARSSFKQSDLEAAWRFFDDDGPDDDWIEPVGLALYLARRIGELHGGGASAYLDANEDLVLRMHLPCRVAATEAVA